MLTYRFYKSFIFSFAFSMATIAAVAQKGDTFRLFFLGGQSNMEGFGYNKELPADLNRPVANAYIFDGNRRGDGEAGAGAGKWEQLRPGHGTGYSYDGKESKLSDRFGPELTFARRMQQLYPADKIAIVKYARNGSSIDSLAAGPFGCWDPDFKGKNGESQYDFALRTLRLAYSSQDINGDGKPDELVPAGILWMQGEGDASFTREIALRYEANLKRLMDLLRAALRVDDLPVVIGKISESGRAEGGRVWKFGELVQHAQEQFVANDARAAIVRSTLKYSYSDPWHYDSSGYIDLGQNFAEAMAKLVRGANR